MSRTDKMRKSLEKQIAETDEERKEREAFEKASSQEKIEKLRKCIDELGQRLDRHIWYMDEVVEKLEQKYGEVREDYRIVSTESILCKVREGEVHNAILLVHGGGIITVKCSAEFCYCKYGLLES